MNKLSDEPKAQTLDEMVSQASKLKLQGQDIKSNESLDETVAFSPETSHQSRCQQSPSLESIEEVSFEKDTEQEPRLYLRSNLYNQQIENDQSSQECVSPTLEERLASEALMEEVYYDFCKVMFEGQKDQVVDQNGQVIQPVQTYLGKELAVKDQNVQAQKIAKIQQNSIDLLSFDPTTDNLFIVTSIKNEKQLKQNIKQEEDLLQKQTKAKQENSNLELSVDEMQEETIKTKLENYQICDIQKSQTTFQNAFKDLENENEIALKELIFCYNQYLQKETERIPSESKIETNQLNQRLKQYERTYQAMRYNSVIQISIAMPDGDKEQTCLPLNYQPKKIEDERVETQLIFEAKIEEQPTQFNQDQIIFRNCLDFEKIEKSPLEESKQHTKNIMNIRKEKQGNQKSIGKKNKIFVTQTEKEGQFETKDQKKYSIHCLHPKVVQSKGNK